LLKNTYIPSNRDLKCQRGIGVKVELRLSCGIISDEHDFILSTKIHNHNKRSLQAQTLISIMEFNKKQNNLQKHTQ
jgi:hypothetical protein